MPQGKKVAIGFQSYDLTRIANIRVADMVLAEAAFPGCGIQRTMPFFLEKPPHQLVCPRWTLDPTDLSQGPSSPLDEFGEDFYRYLKIKVSLYG